MANLGWIVRGRGRKDILKTLKSQDRTGRIGLHLGLPALVVVVMVGGEVLLMLVYMTVMVLLVCSPHWCSTDGAGWGSGPTSATTPGTPAA